MSYFKDFSPGMSPTFQALRGIAAFPYAFPMWVIHWLIKTYVEPKAFGG
jgi:hypothetical protein